MSSFLLSLPIADRVRSHAFYQAALDLQAEGPVADDGVPEPLVFVVNGQTRLMLIPTGGFGWVIGDHDVAPAGSSECLLGFMVDTDAEVDTAIERARAAGATVTAQPARQPWGYNASFADPDGHLWTITCAAS